MMRDRIFLSYRRSDVPAAVGELHAALAERFGNEVIFQDTKAIGPGEEFPVRLRNELARAAFVLVVIGPHWNEVDVHGARRLSDPRDWVRVEVQTALDDRDADVIPVLIDGTRMPSQESLPEPVSAIVERNAIELSVQHLRRGIVPLVTRVSERISPIGATGEMSALRRAVRDQVASIVAAHVWVLWQLLLPHLDETQFSFEPPPGFRDQDVRDLHRVLQWLSDVAGADAGWWRDVTILVAADAAVWVASDLLDRLAPPHDSDSQFGSVIESMHERRRSAVERLTDIVKRQDQIGDREGATRTATMARALYTLDTPKTHTVILDAYIRREDEVDVIGGRPFEFMRTEVSCFVDYLRPDGIEVDQFGEPRDVTAPTAAVYRWGRLLRPKDDTAAVWETRFADDSWFRHVMQRARDEYPSGRLGSFFSQDKNKTS
jgi:TIR domain